MNSPEELVIMAAMHEQKILREVRVERMRQDAKWGPPGDMPSLDPGELEQDDTRSMARFYGVPTEDDAKHAYDLARELGKSTMAHVLIEEVAEVIACMDDEVAMREELVQVAAVAAKWILILDKRAAGEFE